MERPERVYTCGVADGFLVIVESVTSVEPSAYVMAGPVGRVRLDLHQSCVELLEQFMSREKPSLSDEAGERYKRAMRRSWKRIYAEVPTAFVEVFADHVRVYPERPVPDGGMEQVGGQVVTVREKGGGPLLQGILTALARAEPALR